MNHGSMQRDWSTLLLTSESHLRVRKKDVGRTRKLGLGKARKGKKFVAFSSRSKSLKKGIDKTLCVDKYVAAAERR